jgi:hypothetical protein
MAKVSVTKVEFEQAQVLMERLKQFRTLATIREQYSRGSVSFGVDGNHGRASYPTKSTEPATGKAKEFSDRITQQIDAIIASHVLDGIKDVIHLLESQMPFEVEG